MRLIKMISTMLLFVIIISCTSSDKNNSSRKEKMNNKTHPKTISYGTAEISGTVISIKEKEGQQFYVVRIDTVFGYGAGTRPISSDVEIEFNVNDSVEKQLLIKNSSHRLTLRYMNKKFGGKVDHLWEIIKLTQ